MNELTQAQADDLRVLSGIIIPASTEFAMPGADDPVIQADMLATIGRDAPKVAAALEALAAALGCRLAEAGTERASAAALDLRAGGGADIMTATRVVLQTYYRDPRVVRSFGLEARAPFPKGHALEEGDWSLLDPVKARAPFWRQVG